MRYIKQLLYDKMYKIEMNGFAIIALSVLIIYGLIALSVLIIYGLFY